MMNGKNKAGVATVDAKVETRTRTTLTSQEEKIVRMRHGFRAPETMKLEQIGQDHPAAAAMIASIERRAISAVGAQAPQAHSAKSKIISALRGKH